jgi:hypothetical protein
MSVLAINALHHIGGSLSAPTTLAMRAPTFLPGVIFETHLMLWIALIALGAILLFAARSRANMKMLRVGQGVVGVALVWILLARSFETAGERLYAAHEALATATKNSDVTTIVSYMDPSFSVNIPQMGGGGDAGITKENAKEVLAGVLKEMSLSEIHITAYQVILQPNDAAQTLVTVLAKTALGPTKSTWRIHWTDVPAEDWRMVSAVSVSSEKTPTANN